MRLNDVKKAIPEVYYGANRMIDADLDFNKKRRAWFYLWEDAVELWIHWRPSGCAIEMSLTYDLIHLQPDTSLIRRDPIKEVGLLRPLINEVWFEFRDSLRLNKVPMDHHMPGDRLQAVYRFMNIPDEYPTFWERIDASE